MIIFDNISSLILFKHEFTAPLVKCLFFFFLFFEVQANFHHQMLVEPGFFSFLVLSQNPQQTQRKGKLSSHLR